MRRAGLAAGLMLLAAVTATAQKLPDHIGYTVFISGKKVGRSDIKVKYGEGTITFDSFVKLEREDALFWMKSRTVVDAATYHVKSYEFEGASADSISGRVDIDGLDVSVARSVNATPTERTLEWEPVLVIENFVVEHEIILARIHEATGMKGRAYQIVFPTSGAFGKGNVLISATTSIESMIKEAICDKIVVEVEASGPFASFYDPGRGMPVYIAFPSVETEIFLDEFYGENPVSRWIPPEER